MNKVKSLRAGLGISQEELAERTGLSLRTIQRIENGETIPRGDSLRRLCQALGVTIQELREEDAPRKKELEENRSFLALLNLSALAFLLPVPGLGVAVPMVLWLLYRDKIEGVGSMGRRILNFQITWLLVGWLPYVYYIVCTITHTVISSELTPGRMWLFICIVDAFNIKCIVVNAIRAGRQKTTNYAMAIPFLVETAPA